MPVVPKKFFKMSFNFFGKMSLPQSVNFSISNFDTNICSFFNIFLAENHGTSLPENAVPFAGERSISIF